MNTRAALDKAESEIVRWQSIMDGYVRLSPDWHTAREYLMFAKGQQDALCRVLKISPRTPSAGPRTGASCVFRRCLRCAYHTSSPAPAPALATPSP